jgi:hypothetical protein
MAAMNDLKKVTNRDELRRIEDAWVRNTLEASGEELRAEIKEGGDDPDTYVALAEAMLADAREHCGRERLERARAEATAFRAREHRIDVTFKTEIEAGKADPSTPMMLAARKGEMLSERDEEALLRARAKLKRLESEDETE